MVEQIVVKSDDKVLVAGYFTSCNGVPRNNIVQLNSNGSIDGSFVYSQPYSVYPFVVQSDGKIITPSGLRLNTDGGVDNTFAPANSYSNVLAVQPDGKIIVSDGITIIRLTPNGSIDNIFAQHSVFNSFPVFTPSDVSAIVREDGKVVVAMTDPVAGAVVLCWNNDGSEDTLYNVGLIQGMPGGGGNGAIYDIALQADEKVIITGYVGGAGNESSGVIRLNVDGSVDNTFNSQVIYNTGRSLVIQPDGKIVVGGTFQYSDTITGNILYNGIVRLYAEAATCYASFSIQQDALTPHAWIANNLSSSANLLSYTWYWGDGDSSIGISPSHTYSIAGYYNICLRVTDNSGCEDFYCDSSTYIFKTEEVITVNVIDRTQTPSGVLETTHNHSVLIFPNPSNGIFMLTSDIPQDGAVSVYTITGAKVFTSNVSSLNRATIDISQQPKGIYIVKVNNSQGVWTQRVVVE